MLQSLLPRPRNSQAAWLSRRDRSGTDEVCSDLHQTTLALFHKGISAEGTTALHFSFFTQGAQSHSLGQLPSARQEASTWRRTPGDFLVSLRLKEPHAMGAIH